MSVSLESHKQFLALALELRAYGAVRVRDGGLEVVFPEDKTEESPAEPVPTSKRVVYTAKEENELAELRAEKERWEELA